MTVATSMAAAMVRLHKSRLLSASSSAVFVVLISISFHGFINYFGLLPALGLTLSTPLY